MAASSAAEVSSGQWQRPGAGEVWSEPFLVTDCEDNLSECLKGLEVGTQAKLALCLTSNMSRRDPLAISVCVRYRWYFSSLSLQHADRVER